MAAAPSSERDPVEQLLDLVLYAPLGLVTQLDDLLPTLVERGRSQATMARTIGQFAVRSGSTQVQSRVAEVQKQFGTLIHAVSDLHAIRRGAGPRAQSAAETSATADDAVATHAPVSLPIDGYDTMRAADIVPLLADLTDAERRLVAEHERSTRARKTIIARLAQLEARTD